MKVAKVSSLSGLNVGDALISRCIEFLLSKHGITVDSFDLELRELQDFSTYYESNLNKPRKIGAIKSYLNNNIAFRYFYKKYKARLFSAKKVSSRLQGYDVVIFGGGNMFFNHAGCPYLDFFDSLSGKITSIIVVYGVGVGPFSFSWKRSLNNISVKAKYINVRDEKSMSFIEDVNPKVRVSVSPDPVFILSDVYPLATGVKSCFSVNVMDYNDKFYPNVKRNTNLLIDNLVTISRHYSLSLKLIVSSYEDVDYNKFLLESLKLKGCKASIVMLSHKTDFGQVYSDVKFSLCNRMHSSIFSLSYAIPTFVFPWQDKVNGALHEVFGESISNYQVDENFSVNEVVHKVNVFDEALLRDRILNVKSDIYKTSQDLSSCLEAFYES
jgi:polysaccharide pyruvyl transferase WcaK-like protein